MNIGRQFGQGKLFSVLLVVMLTLTIGTLTIVLLAGLWDIEAAGEKVEQLFVEATEHLKAGEVGKENLRVLDGYLERMKAASKECLQAHTTSFLFQVFSVALLSGGAYLVLTSKKEVQEVIEQASHLGEFVGDASATVALLRHASVAVETSCYSLAAGREREFGTQVVCARDLLREFRTRLVDARDNNRGIAEPQHTALLDLTRNILEAINRLSEEGQERVEDISEICKECNKVLKDAKFVKRYEQVFGTLESRRR